MENIFFHKTKSRVFENTVLIDVAEDFLLIRVREGDSFVFVYIFPEGPLGEDEFIRKAAYFGNEFGEIGAALIFSKPLWGGDFLGLKAPSLRDAISIAVSIASGGAASPMLALALNLVDDLAFTAIDVAMGNMTWDEGLFSLAQAGVGSVVGATIGDAFSVAKGSIELSQGIGGVITKTALTGMEMVTSNMVVGAVNSFTYSSNGGLGFDSNRYKEGLIGTKALASYAGGMAGTFVEGTIGMINMKSGSGVQFKDTTMNTYDLGNFGSVVGNAVQAGVEYAIAGETTINILNFRDLAEPLGLNFFKGGRENIFTGKASEGWRSVGMLEIGISRDRGISGKIGMGGIDLSIGKIGSALSGLAETMKVLAYKLGDERKNAELDLIAAAGYDLNEDNWDLAKKMYSGELETGWEDIKSKEGNEGFGYFDRNNKNRIVFSNSLLGGGKDNAAKLVSVLSHEGTHYRGNRIEKKAHEAGFDTYLAVAKGIGANIDAEFAKGIVEEMLNPENAKENTGDRDYWTITVKDGKVEIKHDKENDIYFEYTKDGRTERILLSSHDQDKYNQIQDLKTRSYGLTSAGKPELAKMFNDEADKLQKEYDAVNNNVKNDGWTLERLVHQLSYGNMGNQTKWVNNVEQGGTHGAMFNEAMWKELLAQGWSDGSIYNTVGPEGSYTGNHEWVGKNNQDLSGDFSFDITSYLLSCGGLDQGRLRGFLGDSSIVNDTAFNNIHRPYIEAAMIGRAQSYIKYFASDVNKKSATDSELNNILERERWNLYNLTFGLTTDRSRGDDYNNRMLDALVRNDDFLKEKVETALNWEAEWQTELSDKLEWGYYDQTSYENIPNPMTFSSLCNATSLMEAHDFNVMSNVGKEKKLEVLENLRNIKTWNGNNLIDANGRVNDPILFVKEYAKATNTQLPLSFINWQRIGISSTHNLATFGTAKYMVGDQAKHFVVNRHMQDFTYAPFRNPYPNGEDHDYINSTRFTYIHNLLNYNFWESTR